MPSSTGRKASGTSLIPHSRDLIAPLFDNEYRTRRVVQDLLCSAADHAIIQCRVAARADDEEVDLELGRKPDDVSWSLPTVPASTIPSSSVHARWPSKAT
jgi:hypothetical protein